VTALDPRTGETIWQTGLFAIEGDGFLAHDANEQAVTVLTADGAIRCFDAETGHLLWEADVLGPDSDGRVTVAGTRCYVVSADENDDN
jgi:outer membrane protein assembly factor BamB